MAAQFEDWFEKRYEADRLRREEERRLRDLGYFSKNNGSPCVATSQCAAGYACIDGKCQPINNNPGSGTNDTQGTYVKGCYIYEGDCNSGKRSCSLDATCGRGSGRVDCCGGRLYYGYNAATNSVTGKCARDDGGQDDGGQNNDERSCSAWCEGYYALLGTVSSLCDGQPLCDPECETCSLGKCARRTVNVPCYCNAGRTCDGCKACITDSSSSSFGQCAATDETNNRCRQCVKIESHICCGKDVGPARVCSYEGFGGTTNDLRSKLQAEIRSRCSEACVDFSQPGGWSFTGTQSYVDQGQRKFRTVYASFSQGSGLCDDGGCYPVSYGPPCSHPGKFSPCGESAWSSGISVGPGDCTGQSLGCGMYLANSSGVNIQRLVRSTEAGCLRKTYLKPGEPTLGQTYFGPHFNPGCILAGKWTFNG